MAVSLIFVIGIACFKLQRNRTKQKKESKMLMSKLEDLENATRETARDGNLWYINDYTVSNTII